ncbi:MAG: hypothetical protein FWF59_11830 [Turicibacter sp.]|nr:hypothetical protein [Turicibacter sp.]
MKKWLTGDGFLKLCFAFFLVSMLYFLATGSLFRAAESLVGVLALPLFWNVQKRFVLQFPIALKLYLGLFIFAAIFLGEMGSFYYRFPLWDNALHLSSGFVVAALGYSLVDVAKYRIGVGLKSVFALSFAMMVGTAWEFIEFFMDFFTGSNMQKFMLEDGMAFVGEQALLDTMQDLLECALGAGILLLLVLLERKFKWRALDWFLVRGKGSDMVLKPEGADSV